MKYSTVVNDDSKTVTVLLDGELKTFTTTDRDQFWDLVSFIEDDDVDTVRRIISPAKAVEEAFKLLSGHVAVKGGTIYYDYEPVHGSVAQKIVEFVEQGLDFAPLVLFLEKLHNYKTNQSVDQVYSWLEHNQFTLNSRGNIIGYKSVASVPGGYSPSRSGHGIVNGTEINGVLLQNPGDTVSIPRSEVQFDPAVGCSTGLHVANYDYAKQYTGDTILLVEVDPTDIVSVPTECDWQKMRVCRYTILSATSKGEAHELGAYYASDSEATDEWGDELDEDVCD